LEERRPSRAERRRAKNARRRERVARRRQEEKARKDWELAAAVGHTALVGDAIEDLGERVQKYGWWGAIWRMLVKIAAIVLIPGAVCMIYLWWPY
jgi:hypothetical protein